MRVLNLCTQDIAGIGHRTAQAFARYAPEIEFDHVSLHRNYLAYPPGRDPSEIPALVKAADVVMVHKGFKLVDRYQIDKPVVVMHHGTAFRKHHERLLAETERRGAVGVVTTLDLRLYAPDRLTWIPPAYVLDHLASFRRPTESKRLRVAHAPTKRSVKSTDAFLAACKRVGVEPVLIERKPWDECLRIKGTCDVLYDQVRLVPGCNSIEAWGMGIPVIAGAPGHVLDEYRREFGQLPFVEATEATIADALDRVRDEAVRAEYARRGKGHAIDWHDGRETVARLTAIFRKLIDGS